LPSANPRRQGSASQSFDVFVVILHQFYKTYNGVKDTIARQIVDLYIVLVEATYGIMKIILFYKKNGLVNQVVN